MIEMTDQEFDQRLEAMIKRDFSDNPSRILDIPRIRDILSGYFLDRIFYEWEEKI